MTDFARIMTSAAIALAAGAGAVWAQGSSYSPTYQVQAVQNPVCARLEGQLAVIDRGGFADPVRADQNRRYEEAINRQQADLDRMVAQARRLSCESGFFSIFTTQNPQCPHINQQIQQMRANLDRMLSEQQRLQGGSGGHESQRQMVIAALAQNNCGPQYRAAANQERGLFDTLFGNNQGGFGAPGYGAPDGSATYRTLCVRTCDGYYFPVSFATTPARFRDDEQICQRTCPGAEVTLYSHRNPGEEVAKAVSTGGKLYSELATAFKYRQEFVPSCSCRKPGQSWADALGQSRDMTVERGDIVVTQERSRIMSAPRDAQGRPIARQDARRDPRAQTQSSADPAPTADTTSDEPDRSKRPVRVVGPPFVPTNR